ncbi:MAG: hypothetical protein DCC59_12075 [Chloroflexi bacterium]|nr:hypothetical protein [Chloroflexi bacterium CFX1]MCK6568608.1 hypothetical protein [Anaerolineales bacterium]MCQ3954253.1 hypothetical protein [Chloroflexota bacterium]MDL1920758.1 hypothetical protein [Chloroflexi bacterium CFX5]NUQ60311.1 hypothetical protein [Anaerolineales bacterium]
MSASQTFLFAGGIYHLALAIFHVFFWRIFHWKKDLAALTRINRAVVQILNLCLTFLFIVMAYVSFVHASELISSPLGRTILASIALFWILRLILQFVFFGARHRVSILFIAIFAIGASLYLLPSIWSLP